MTVWPEGFTFRVVGPYDRTPDDPWPTLNGIVHVAGWR